MKPIHLLLFVFFQSAYSLPSDPNVILGDASFALEGDAMAIKAGENAVIDWNSFSIEETESVRFSLPSSESAVLNRVVASDPSRILGSLYANGKVVLINPNGIVFGPKSSIDAGSLIATTLDLQNEVFLNGKALSFKGDSTAAIEQFGRIESMSGDIFLIGKSIVNRGEIHSANGRAGLLGASSVSLSVEPPSSIALNGESLTYGSIAAKEIYLLGNYVGAMEGSLTDASLPTGGGQIFVGGGFYGTEPDLGSALRVFIHPSATLSARAIEEGNGGSIAIWSKEATFYHGYLDARGGAVWGDGGRAEVSGPYLEFQGKVDLGAANGKMGTLLLDPSDIEITSAMSSTTVTVGNPTTWTSLAVPNSPILITPASIVAALGSADVVINTNASFDFGNSGSITVTDGVTWPSNTSLTLLANTDIFVNANINATGSYAGNQIVLQAGVSGIGDVRIGFPGQTITVFVQTNDAGISVSGRNIFLGDPATGSNGVSYIAATGPLNVASALNLVLQASQSPLSVNASVSLSSTGNQVITAGQDILVSAGIDTMTHVTWFSAADQTVTATGAMSMTGGGTPGAGNPTDILMSALGNQTIQCESLNMQGGNGDNSQVVIQSFGFQRVVAAGGIRLSGTLTPSPATNGTYARLITLMGANQEIEAGQLDLLGGLDVNSEARISSSGTQRITITGSTFMRGGQSMGAVNGARAEILSTGDQIVRGGSLTMIAGNHINSDAQILGDADQEVRMAGPISMTTVYDFASSIAQIRYGQNQIVEGSTLTMIGSSIDNGLEMIPGPYTQTLSFTSDVSMQGGWDPINSLPLSSTINCDFSFMDVNRQNFTAGGNFTAAAYLGSPAEFGHVQVRAGPDSSLTVGGNMTFQSGSGTGFASFTTRENSVHHIGGDLLIDSPSPNNPGTATFFVNVANYSLTVDGNAMIGTPASQGIQTLDLNTDFSIAVGGNFTIQGGQTPGSISEIKQSNGFSSFPSASIVVGDNLSLIGGSGNQSYAYIQTLGATTVQTGQDLSIQGGIGTDAEAYLVSLAIDGVLSGGQFFSPVTQTIEAGRNVIVQGGNSAGGQSYGFILGFLAQQTVSAAGDVFILAGTGAPNNHAMIGGGWADVFPLIGFTIQDTTSLAIRAANSILMQNDASGSLAYIDQVLAGILDPIILGPALMSLNNIGTMSILANKDVTLSTSIATIEAPAPADSVIHSITVNADNPFTFGAMWAGSSHPFLAGTPLASASPALGQTTYGGFKVDTGPIGNGISFTSQAGFIYLSSGEHFSTGPFDNLIIGPSASTNLLTITSITGNITVDPFHNITVTNGVTTGGNVFMIAQNDIDMTASGFITAGGSVELVADNQAPTPPLIGPGGFHMDALATITSGSTLRIFTARPTQNAINGLLNGAPFIAGTFFIDSATEIWCTYFPSALSGTPYTIFYKPCLQQATEQATIVNTEMLLNFHPYDEYLGWLELFDVTPIYEYEFKEPFMLRRRKLKFINHPKSWTALIY